MSDTATMKSWRWAELRSERILRCKRKRSILQCVKRALNDVYGSTGIFTHDGDLVLTTFAGSFYADRLEEYAEVMREHGMHAYVDKRATAARMYLRMP